MAHAPILLTRPDAAACRFAGQIRDRLGAGPVVRAPVLEIIPVGDLPSLSGYRGLVLTSQNALIRTRPDWPGDLTAWCVGSRTAARARAAGFATRSSDGALPDLVAMIRAAAPKGPLMHLRGQFSAGNAAQELSAAGIPTQARIVYDQRSCPLNAEAMALLRDPGPVLVPVFSPRSARALAPALAQAQASCFVAAISPAVAEALPVQSARRTLVASHPTSDAVLDCLAELNAGLHA